MNAMSINENRIKIYSFNGGDLQKAFDAAIKKVDEYLEQGAPCVVDLITPKSTKRIVEGYFDINDKGLTIPWKWFNKEVLDLYKINYL